MSDDREKMKEALERIYKLAEESIDTPGTPEFVEKRLNAILGHSRYKEVLPGIGDV